MRAGLRAEDGLLLGWLALALVAHRAALSAQPVGLVDDPVEAFFFEANQSSPLLHYALFALVLWSRRFALQAAVGARPRWIPGLLCSAAGFATAGWAYAVGQSDLLLDAFVWSAVGTSLLVGGTRMLGVMVLPLALLWLARPLPPTLVHHLHEWLQAGSTSFAVWTLSPLGEVQRSAYMMHFWDRLFEVVENCSGLRIIQTMLMATLVYAELFSRSRVQTVGLFVLSPFIGFVVNGVRVDSIMLNPYASEDAIHSGQGLAMISGGVFLLAGVDRLLRPLWPRGSRAWRAGRADAPVADPRRARPRLYTVLGIAGALVALSLVDLRLAAPARDPWQIGRIPMQLGLWKREMGFVELDQRFLGTVKFDDKLIRRYTRLGDAVLLVATVNDRPRRGRSGYSPKTASLGSGWAVLESEPLQLVEPPVRVERMLQERAGEQALVYHWRLGARPLWREALRWYLALDLDPRAPAGQVLSFRVSTPILDDGVEPAERRLRDFLRRLAPHLAEVAPERLRRAGSPAS